MTPLVFAILAATAPDRFESVLYDGRLELIPLDLDVDLVALTVETFTARRAYQIAGAFRWRGIPVVMGGYHPTLLPEEASQHAAAIVEFKRRNPRFGGSRIAQQTDKAFVVAIDKDVVRRVLTKHYRPGPDAGRGPYWLTLIGDLEGSLWSIDMFVASLCC